MTNAPTERDDWFERVPKLELHVHLEGSIPLEALWQLVGKYGGTDEIATLDDLRKRFAYRDFPHFIDTWVWKNGFLRSYEDFEWIAEAVASWWRSQRIVYVETFYSPSDFARHGLGTQELTAAIRRGLGRVSGIEVSLVADFVRDRGPENALTTLAEVTEVRDLGVVGVGIGGSEQQFPPEPFGPVFERAREAGFRTSAHAGEAAGPASIRGALDALRADRIGHGTRAREDPGLVARLARDGVPVELCPLSNLRTGVIERLKDHPVREYLAAGVRVSVNTDDPAMFGNTLAEELRHLETTFGLSRDEIREVLLGTVDQTWQEAAARDALRERLRGGLGG